MSYLEELSRALVMGGGIGLGIAVVSVVCDEVRGYRRMKRFAAAAARSGRKSLWGNQS